MTNGVQVGGFGVKSLVRLVARVYKKEKTTLDRLLNESRMQISTPDYPPAPDIEKS